MKKLVKSAPDAAFWRGKKILLTGHTGFKGGWLALWLERLGAIVTGLGLAPLTVPDLFGASGLDRRIDSRIGDIRDAAGVSALVREIKPEIVFHLAAQPLVRASYADPLETFHTNILGTAHVLDALRGLRRRAGSQCSSPPTKSITTMNGLIRIGSRDRLGGHDPYSASKAAANWWWPRIAPPFWVLKEYDARPRAPAM